MKLKKLLKAFGKNEVIEVCSEGSIHMTDKRSILEEELWNLMNWEVVSMKYTIIYFEGNCFGYSIKIQ